jgi:glycosyltransferase involved in cell wall biosynthesis
VVIHAQLTGLLPRHEVTLLTVAGPDKDHRDALDDLRDKGIETYAVWREQAAGLELWRRRCRLAGAWLLTRYPWLTVLNWDRRAQQMLNRLLAKREFDLISVYDKAEMGVYSYKTTVPMLLTEQEVRQPRPIDWRNRSRSNAVAWALREADWRRWAGYQRRVWRRFDRIQVFTPYDAQAMRRMAPEISDRIRINPFGIEVSEKAEADREEPETLVFVGSFGHRPNVDAALWLGDEVMPLLRARRPGVRLFIVGSEPPTEVRDLASENIIVTGRVPEVEPFIERAAVVLAPVRTGGGQRTKVLQGMAMGKAVITTPLGAEGLELAGEQPPVVVRDDVEGIVASTIDLLDSPGTRQKLGRCARAAVEEHYSPEAFARRMEAVCAELRSGHYPAGARVLERVSC